MKMPSLRNLIRAPIKCIFCGHLVLLYWILQIPYITQFTLVYNLLFFVTLFWATENTESDEPLQFAIWINVISIIFEGSVLISYPDGVLSSYGYYYGVTLIMSLLMRIFTSISLYMIGRARNEAVAGMFSSSPMTVTKMEEANGAH
ncbi:uncharacterized protein LOC107273443 [Cephus cinctus]|uniref:Uncharacterized protein LOC107273443 n=1 Tax=Cephus cinctus TaxID=211228 RepID=A0AAJ7W6P3_CEPCN|nr:uncharacterized protein LOC107273443 [Cephus cinctus]